MDKVEIYKAQTLAVESLLAHHPEFDPARDSQFSSEELGIFKAVFQPNWDDYNDDYREVYRHFMEEEPKIMAEAQSVLNKFFKTHGVDPDGLEL